MSYDVKTLPGGIPAGLDGRRIGNYSTIDIAPNAAPLQAANALHGEINRGRPSLRLVQTSRRRFPVRISLDRGLGRSRAFDLSETDLRQLVDLAVRLEGGAR